jgi:hypothetical protein
VDEHLAVREIHGWLLRMKCIVRQVLKIDVPAEFLR